ncbi:dephospho-CoA kinase [Phaeobacter sp.]|uniref:dephospho-CoA kinase n=1 Tax=Phaeobacter sp. TaxID=1902409 RepID=UPI002600AE1F|nr:dephospho-CoA kinase [Phaeobacter sp.]
MTFALGLTGSIGMGKSTTAQLFADEGCGIWDADAAVHRLYDVGGAAVAALAAKFPYAIVDQKIDRAALRDIISKDPSSLAQIEAIVHPLVAADRADFRASAAEEILVFDIPLLFETGGHTSMDAVACVWTDPATQRQRVMDRGTMTVEQFEQILQKQMPIEEKKSRSDYLIQTDSLDHARQQVRDILNAIRKQLHHA